MRKEHLDGTKKVSEKKNSFKVLLQNRSSSNLQSRYFEVQRAIAQKVKVSKERSWEKFGHQLDSNYLMAN